MYMLLMSKYVPLISMDIIILLLYLKGIPEAAEVAVPVAHYPASQTGGATAVAVSGATNMVPPV